MLGIATIKSLVERNIEVVAISRKGSRRRDKLPVSELITFIEADLSELNTIELPSGEYDVFYHFGWANTDKVSRNNPELQNENVQYTLDAIKLAHKFGCKKFLFAGSQAEYGVCNEKITVDTPVNPQVAYGICKYAAEKLGKLECDSLGMVFIGCRIFSVYGANDSENSMISYALKQFKKGEIAKFSAGTQMWNYLHEKDAGEIFALLGDKCEESKIYLVAHPESKQLKEYIKDIKSVLGEAFQCTLAEEPTLNIVSLNVDASLLYEDVEGIDTVSFRDGFNKVLREYS